MQHHQQLDVNTLRKARAPDTIKDVVDFYEGRCEGNYVRTHAWRHISTWAQKHIRANRTPDVRAVLSGE
jgi:hypothetical protein